MNGTLRIRKVWWGRLIKVGLLLALVLGLHLGGRETVDWLGNYLEHNAMGLGLAGLIVGLLLYVVLLSLPFVPGMEIGIALMMVFGSRGIVMVYGATWAALTLSFLFGRLVPSAALSRFLQWLHLSRAEALVRKLAPLNPPQKLATLLEAAPSRIIPALLRHRYLTLALAFNTPGNVLIGGGGGIGLMAGMSELFNPLVYVLVVALAVAPVPLLLLGGEAIRMWIG